MKLPPFREFAGRSTAPRHAMPAGRWMVGIASILIVVAGVTIPLVSWLNHGRTGLERTSPSTAVRATSQTPSSAFSPDVLTSVPFTCSGGRGIGSGPSGAIANLVRIEPSTGPEYERLTFAFLDLPPDEASIQVQAGTTFAELPSGRSVALEGKYGVLLVLRRADGHSAYRGSTDLKPLYPVMREVRQIEDFDGTLAWAIGLSRTPCYRIGYLTGPFRVAVDFQAG